MNKEFVFFLGGNDAEMVEIKNTLISQGCEVMDKGLGWGAKVSDYAEEIAATAATGQIPVLVELEVGEDDNLPQGTVIIDHHGASADKPASLLQVLYLLQVEPTRRQLLVAANDSGYIPAMLALGATAKEIAKVREVERAAQGVEPEQEAEAERAIREANGHALAATGELVVIRMAHSKCATVSDRLFSSWKDGKENLLILSGDGEVNFFGNGALCSELKEKFEGWAGGSGLGKKDGQGYWGGYPDQKKVEEYIRSRV